MVVLDDLSTGRIENLPSECALIRGDVADPGAVRRAMNVVDGCFHLAAIASVVRANEDWLGTHRANQTGTITVLDEARRLGGVPVVYASSAAIYGALTGIAHEDAVPAPLTAYGADKLGSELHARVATLVHGVPAVGLRFFNIYGPRQDPRSPYSGVISLFANAVANGEPIRILGDGQQSRDFVFVADVVAHLATAMTLLQDRGAGALPPAMNVCTGEETTILGLAHVLGEACGMRPSISFGPERLGDIRRSVGSPALAQSALGIKALVSLRSGVEPTLRSIAPLSAARAVA